jgi:hypothetical protein
VADRGLSSLAFREHIPSSFFGEAQVVDFARVSRRSRVRYWVRSGLIPSRAKALVWSGVGRA